MRRIRTNEEWIEFMFDNMDKSYTSKNPYWLEFSEGERTFDNLCKPAHTVLAEEYGIDIVMEDESLSIDDVLARQAMVVTFTVPRKISEEVIKNGIANKRYFSSCKQSSQWLMTLFDMTVKIKAYKEALIVLEAIEGQPDLGKIVLLNLQLHKATRIITEDAKDELFRAGRGKFDFNSEEDVEKFYDELESLNPEANELLRRISKLGILTEFFITKL